jgi:hypothetical protein
MSESATFLGSLQQLADSLSVPAFPPHDLSAPCVNGRVVRFQLSRQEARAIAPRVQVNLFRQLGCASER